MASIKVEFECWVCRCGCFSDDENSKCWEEDKTFDAWYVFDVPGISGTVDMYELDNVPWLLQDCGIIPQSADTGDKFIITLWEGTDEEFSKHFGALGTFRTEDIRCDENMPKGWWNAVKSLWGAYWDGLESR